jgi:hypothetical protein
MSNEPSRELSQPEKTSGGTTGILERFDLADDLQVINALSKRVAPGFTYKVNGKHGLSSSGTLWAVREFAKQGEVYRVVGDVDIKACPLDPDCINVTLKVQRFFVNPATGQEIALDTTIGHKRMSRKTKRYTDPSDPTKFEMVEDPEFTTKAITKAERNGKLKLLPKDAVTNLIAKATGQAAGDTKPPPPKQQQTPSGGSAPAGTATTPPPGATPPKPPATPPVQPPAGPPAQAPAAGAGASPAKPPPPPPMTREVKIQKLDAVSKSVFGTTDGAQARAKLAQLTGKPSPADLNDDEMKAVGNAINAVATKKAKIEGNNIIRLADNVVLWKGPEIAAAAAPAPEAPPAEEEMF